MVGCTRGRVKKRPKSFVMLGISAAVDPENAKTNILGGWRAGDSPR